MTRHYWSTRAVSERFASEGGVPRIAPALQKFAVADRKTDDHGDEERGPPDSAPELVPDDLLHLVVEIKGYRREDAKEKKSTMDTYWVPGVNHLGAYGRWAFAEFTEVYQIEADFESRVESEFNNMIETTAAQPVTGTE